MIVLLFPQPSLWPHVGVLLIAIQSQERSSTQLLSFQGQGTRKGSEVGNADAGERNGKEVLLVPPILHFWWLRRTGFPFWSVGTEHSFRLETFKEISAVPTGIFGQSQWPIGTTLMVHWLPNQRANELRQSANRRLTARYIFQHTIAAYYSSDMVNVPE